MAFDNLNEFRKNTGEKYKNNSDQSLIDHLYKKEVQEPFDRGDLLESEKIDFYTYNQKMSPTNAYSSIDNFKNNFKNIYGDLDEKTPYEVGRVAHEELKKRGSLVEFADFFDQFNPAKRNIDIGFTRIPLDDNDFRPITGNPTRSLKERETEAGFDTQTDVSRNKIRFQMGFGDTPADRLMKAKTALSEEFKEYGPVNTEIDDFTGEIVFDNPKSGKRQLLNKPGLDASDISSLGGDALVLAGDGLGILAGGALGGIVNPTLGFAGATAGSGLGTAYADALRLAIGHRYFDMNAQFDSDETLGQSFKRYLEEKGKFDETNALITAAGITLPQFVKMASSLVKTGKIDVNRFNDPIQDSKPSMEILDQTNARLAQLGSDKKMKYNLGQASGDPILLSVYNKIAKNENYGQVGKVAKMEKEQFDALNTFFGLSKGKFNNGQLARASNDQEVALESSLRNIIKQRQDPIRQAAIRRLENSQADLTNEVVEIAPGVYKDEGQKIRTIFDEIDKSVFDSFKGRYAALGKAGQKVEFDTKTLVSELEKMSNKEKNSFVKKKTTISQVMKDLPEKMNFEQFMNTRSDLLGIQRDIARGESIGPKGFPSTLINEMNNIISTQLKKKWPEVYSEFTGVDNAYKKYKEDFGGIVNTVLQARNGRLMIGNENVFEQTFKPSKNLNALRNIRELNQIFENHPEKRQLYADSIMSFYRQKVAPDGTPVPKLHKKFMDDYGENLKIFFKPNEYAKINKLNGLTEVVEKNQIKLDRIQKKLKDSSFGQIDTIAPEEIFRKSYIEDKPVTLNRVLNVMKKDPEILKGYQKQVTDDIYKNITDERGQFVFKNYISYMKKNDKKIKKIFANEPEYVKDLELFGKNLEIVSRKANLTTKTSFPQKIKDFVRGTAFGQFTKEGRLFQLFSRVYGDSMDEQMAQIVLDPDKLKQFNKLKSAKGEAFEKMFKTVFNISLKVDEDTDVYNPLLNELVEEKYERDINQDELNDILNPPPEEIEEEQQPMSKNISPSVNIFAMEQMPRPTEPAPVTPPPVQQPQPAGIAALPADRGQTYAGLFPNDPSGQMIAQRGTPNART